MSKESSVEAPPRKRKRTGARAALHAMRAATVPMEERPVRPGFSGGAFRPLTDAQVLEVNEAVMETLETIGLSQAIPSCVERVVAAGGTYTDEGRLLFPRALVEDTIANAARNFTLYGQSPEFDMELTGTRTYFGTAGAAVHIVDCDTREYRESTLADLYDIARLVDKLDNIHFFQRSIVARDMIKPRDLDFNTCYASVMGTRKHVGTSWVEPEHVTESLKMLHTIAGSEAKWRERPFVSQSNCFVVPPLRFAEDACRCLEVAVEGGMPVLLLAAGQAGATSPASLAGALVQEVAEVLAGLVYVNLIVPGHPAIFGTWPFISDLRTGAMSGGSGEQAILMAACGQMANFYDLPGGVAAGMSDAKLPDAQAGYEKGIATTLAGHSGTNLVYESAGMHGSLMGACFESFVIDNDMLGSVQRTIRGLEIDTDSLSIQAMKDVCMGGPNHFLGHDQTIARMQKDYIYPDVADRLSPKEWAEQGSLDILQKATTKLHSIMRSHYPIHIDEAMDEKIRAEFEVNIPRADMLNGNGRW